MKIRLEADYLPGVSEQSILFLVMKGCFDLACILINVWMRSESGGYLV